MHSLGVMAVPENAQDAAVRIQSAWAAHRTRQAFLVMRDTCRAQQRRYRELVQRQEEEEYLQLIEADEEVESTGPISQSQSGTTSTTRGSHATPLQAVPPLGSPSRPVLAGGALHANTQEYLKYATSLRVLIEDEQTERNTTERCAGHHYSRLWQLHQKELLTLIGSPHPVFQTNKQKRLQHSDVASEELWAVQFEGHRFSSAPEPVSSVLDEESAARRIQWAYRRHNRCKLELAYTRLRSVLISDELTDRSKIEEEHAKQLKSICFVVSTIISRPQRSPRTWPGETRNPTTKKPAKEQYHPPPPPAALRGTSCESGGPELCAGAKYLLNRGRKQADHTAEADASIAASLAVPPSLPAPLMRPRGIHEKGKPTISRSGNVEDSAVLNSQGGRNHPLSAPTTSDRERPLLSRGFSFGTGARSLIAPGQILSDLSTSPAPRLPSPSRSSCKPQLAPLPRL
eukprot:TRINITY_DN67429_c0_g1_i1.p2 TRINITY_DN67429_c0_g1~~TRINITY_DN67429_c0_g1_i1.p2  ORF type:complete len:458 (+),score=40.21 TRINITY_DN67429_c0_g1_i1:80-1453(+)